MAIIYESVLGAAVATTCSVHANLLLFNLLASFVWEISVCSRVVAIRWHFICKQSMRD